MIALSRSRQKFVTNQSFGILLGRKCEVELGTKTQLVKDPSKWGKKRISVLFVDNDLECVGGNVMVGGIFGGTGIVPDLHVLEDSH